MTERVLVPGGRDVRATLDSADGDAPGTDSVVVACPPHPQHGGRRGDERLTAVGDALVARGIDCLRFDYGPWDGGNGERVDADNAVDWAFERYDRVGLFGFSFGGAIALVTAADRPALSGVCALAPTARIAADGDVGGPSGGRASPGEADAVDSVGSDATTDSVAALDDLADSGVPTSVVYATRDTTADWEPVVERARELGLETGSFDADHLFVGRTGDVADAVAEAFDRRRSG